MTRTKNHSLLGGMLIMLGGFLLLDHWYPELFGWNTILIALGVALLIRALGPSKGSALPGAFLLLLGLFFLLKEANIIYVLWWQNWPLIILILGISFVTQFVFDPHRRGALMTGIILIALAFIFLRYRYRWDDIVEALARWWPLILVLIGLRMIWKTAVGPR